MKKKEDVLELFRKKYDHLKTIFPSVGEFKESALYQTPDEGWQLSIDSFAAITLRPNNDEVHETHGAICDRWYKEGGAFNERHNPGWLGHPISDEEVYEGDGDSNDRISHFEHGDIIWTAKTGETRVVGTSDVNMSMPHRFSDGLPDKVKQLKLSVKQALEEINEIAKKIPNGEDWKEAKEKVLGIRESIEPYLKGFDSQAFFIVTFGMLKAGKSTLVNTLVGRDDVSPVGHGRETTKRSSIIFSADSKHPEGVYIYKLKDSTPPSDYKSDDDRAKWRGEKCEQLLLALGGVGDIEDAFSCDGPRKLSEVDDLLTSEPSESEFPPVIRINQDKNARFPEDSILNDGVAILDTPGLDGIGANAENDCFWQVLPAQGDFFLLVQSSMSGLNSDCANQIARIYGKTENSPGILIVYNEIASQFWLKDEVEKEKLKEDRKKVTDYLRSKLCDVSRGADPDIISVNAGAASAAKFETERKFSERYSDPRSLYEESRFAELRTRLLKTLKQDRARIKVTRLRGLIGRRLADDEKYIEKLKGSLGGDKTNKIEESRRKRESIKGCAENLIKFFAGSDGERLAKRLSGTAVSFASTEWSRDSMPDVSGIEGRTDKEKCKRKIIEYVEKVNKAFAGRIRNSVVPGAAILDVEPWDSFAPPPDVLKNYKEIIKFLDGDGAAEKSDDEFRSRLLCKLQQGEIEKALGRRLQEEESEFNGFLRWLGVGVARGDFECRIREVKYKLEGHFGLVDKMYGEDPPAKMGLKKYIEETILGSGRDLAKYLYDRVIEKVEKSEGEDKEWTKNNNNAVECLAQMLSHVKKIHEQIKND